MKTLLKLFVLPALAVSVLAGCETQDNAAASAAAPAVEATAKDLLVSSMKAKNQATMDRLNQDELQAACSNANNMAGDAAAMEALRKAAEASVVYPADGNYIGDWKNGNAIAANGKGLQWNDDPSEPNGGNCYACHQLDPNEVAYGTLGPSLTNYGMRGQSEMMLKYTWAKIYNPHVYNVCSHMPRFGSQKILTEQQLKDIMALLLDPNSPVNQ